MKKSDFDNRNSDKQYLHFENKADFFVNSREIWFVKMGVNVWYEENGKKEFRRPVLVIKKVGVLFFTVALTTKGKQNNKFYHALQKVSFHEKNSSSKSACILSQVKVMDKKRFMHKIWEVDKEEFENIKKKLRSLLT